MALRLISEHKLSAWEFGFNRRKCALGLCRHAERRIELSAYFVMANDEAAIRDVILHEIAHALAGYRAGHGPKWRAICERIGAVPERCGEARMPGGAWQASCPACKQSYTRHRRPRRGMTHYCGDCGEFNGPLTFRRTNQNV